MASLRSQMRYMNPYDLHKLLINEYVLKKPGDTKLLRRNKSNDKTDYDVIRENHKFLWEDDAPDTWEAQFAKKYYDKLFKEYCIGDLRFYKENKIALRWRIEREVVSGKGQFTCGNKECVIGENLRTWEVNFAYREQGEKKNALVKIRLCPDCSNKLNYRSKKREIKRLERKSKYKNRRKENKSDTSWNDNENVAEEIFSSGESIPTTSSGENVDKTTESPWEVQKTVESKSRDEEMEDYLQDLLF